MVDLPYRFVFFALAASRLFLGSGEKQVLHVKWSICLIGNTFFCLGG